VVDGVAWEHNGLQGIGYPEARYMSIVKNRENIILMEDVGDWGVDGIVDNM
jgi:hypothetical protein